MSLVDRWLTRQIAGIATSATTATWPKTARTVTGAEVATGLRHPATSESATTGSPNLSRPVATGQRQEKAQDAAVYEQVSPLSQKSQRAFPVWDGAEEERASISEHDGKIPRAWAEGFARLHPDRPPANVPPRRWLRFIDDIRLFLGGGWAKKAAALGWGPLDLFGCDCDRPFARIDRAGLLWLLNGDKLFALSADTATIETRTGARQTYRRKPAEPGRVLAWELAS